MRVWRKNVILNRLFLFSIIFGFSLIGQSAFADPDPSISISINPVSITLQPGEFGTASQTITASTTNSTGYTIKLGNSSNTTDLVNTADNTKVLPTFKYSLWLIRTFSDAPFKVKVVLASWL